MERLLLVVSCVSMWSLPKIALCCVVLSFCCQKAACAETARANGLELEVEAGGVFPSRNDVKSPGDEGTLISLTDDLSSSLEFSYRARIGYRHGERHLFSLLYAPLELTADGSIDKDVRFEMVEFPAGEPLRATYRFDSYRFTYRYSFFVFSDFEIAVGGTAKIRDAEIRIQGSEADAKTNRGFVPLVNLHLEWRPANRSIGVLLDADAAAAPQGRAEDVLLAATYRLSKAFDLYLGYRTLEGGADNEQVYTFSWFHYGVAGLRIRL